jgi:ornithine decarboxylase
MMPGQTISQPRTAFWSPKGPTCDSIDVVYEHSAYELPPALTSGGFASAALSTFCRAMAHTASYAPVEFNGFEPIPNYFI